MSHMLTMTPMGGSSYDNSGMSAIKSISFFLLFVGIVLITIGYVQSENLDKPPRIMYRYVPRSFEESQAESTPLLSIYGSMFENRDPLSKINGYVDTYPWEKQLINNSSLQPYKGNTGFGREVGQRIIT
jgi:hypothetical protein